MSQIPELFSKLPGWQQIAWILWAICGLLLLATALLTLGRQTRASTAPATTSATLPAHVPVATNGSSVGKTKALIVFLQVPPSSGGPIAGEVRNIASPERYKLVVYAKTDKWYVQPTNTQEALATIQPDGSWKSWTRNGTEFAALVVRQTYTVDSPVETPPVTGMDVIVAAVEPAAARKELP